MTSREAVVAGGGDYLERVYWWAYVHPWAVRIFDRGWLVNLILFGNYRRLREAAFAALGELESGTTLQVACVYGDFTPTLLARHGRNARLRVVDRLPVQLRRLRAKLAPDERLTLEMGDAASLGLPEASVDRAVMFFLLHEVPQEIRRAALTELWRVVKPGGKLVIVDYGRPAGWHPLRPLMALIYRLLEPFAADFVRQSLAELRPSGLADAGVTRQTFFGGLYQLEVWHR